MPNSHSTACELPPDPAEPAFPVSGGRGVAIGVPVDAGVNVPVVVGVVVPVATGVVVPVAAGVVVPVVVGVVVPVAVGVVVPVAVGVSVPVPGVKVVVAPGVVVAGTTSLVTVAVQIVSAPPPFADPLHWSTFTGKVEVIVDPAPTVQVNPTLVPPLPEPLH
jgi:hypothetical protein